MDVQRDIGALEARMDNVERELRECRADVRKILEHVSAAKGSWRALVVVGGVLTALVGMGTALSGAVTAAVNWLRS